MNYYYNPFVIPFNIGVVFLICALGYLFIRWFVLLTPEDKSKIYSAFTTKKSFGALKDAVCESLLHHNIFKINGRLGYMHMSLALGWFLLIVVGKFETSAYLKDGLNLPHVHVFFRYFFPEEPHRFVHNFNYAAIMDFLLLFVLSGVALAYYKRARSRFMGLKKTTKHTLGDRIALTALWLIFPLRWLAESATCGVHDSGSFFTGNTGDLMASFLPLEHLELPLWWAYSIALGAFFCALPFSRYLHIFAEIPHIFLRRYEVHAKDTPSIVDNVQMSACSRCGICIDPCQMQRDGDTNDMQAVYFLRDRRYGHLQQKTADNCLMCGRCEVRCPVNLDLNALRQSARSGQLRYENVARYDYFKPVDRSSGEGKTGYFAGCMTLLSPKVLAAMNKIFAAVGEDVWYADRDGGVCCGRPLKLAGDLDGARKMIEYNTELFHKHGITTLVTSCPICLKVFREDYRLQGIRVLHHTEYIAEMMRTRRLKPTPTHMSMTYHDPCELGRGSGIYEAPRTVIEAIGTLTEPRETRENALCCGGSLANGVVEQKKVYAMAHAVTSEFVATGAELLVTACPMCKKTLRRSTKMEVQDISEVVANAL